MNFKIGPIVGLIGSSIMLFMVIMQLMLGYGDVILSVIFSFVWPAMGIVGAFMGYSGKKKLGGSLLVIAGPSKVFFELSSIMRIDWLLMILGGILVLMVVEREKDEPQEELAKREKKRSTTLFITGSIIIGIASSVIWWDLGLRSLWGWSGIISGVMVVPYVFSVLLIVYSIHLIGCKWAWLDLPIAIVIIIYVLFLMVQLSNRIIPFLILPLNYAVLLILFLVFNRKRTSEKPNSN